MGQQIVGSLAECVTTALNQAIPAFVDNMNPMAKLKTAASIVQGFNNDDPKSNGQSGQGNQGSTQPTAAQGPPSQQQAAPAPPAITDPALAESLKSTYLFDTLHAIIKGQDGGVNWEAAKGVAPDSADAASKAKATKSGIGFVTKMLESAKKDFQDVATQQQDSVSYLKVLADSERVSFPVPLTLVRG